MTHAVNIEVSAIFTHPLQPSLGHPKYPDTLGKETLYIQGSDGGGVLYQWGKLPIQF